MSSDTRGILPRDEVRASEHDLEEVLLLFEDVVLDKLDHSRVLAFDDSILAISKSDDGVNV